MVWVQVYAVKVIDGPGCVTLMPFASFDFSIPFPYSQKGGPPQVNFFGSHVAPRVTLYAMKV